MAGKGTRDGDVGIVNEIGMETVTVGMGWGWGPYILLCHSLTDTGTHLSASLLVQLCCRHSSTVGRVMFSWYSVSMRFTEVF